MTNETFTYKGQVYRITGVEKRDGKPSMVEFESECAECGCTFSGKQRFPMKWPSRRCALHKAPGVRVSA